MTEQEARKFLGSCSNRQLQRLAAARDALSLEEWASALVNTTLHSTYDDFTPSETDLVYLKGEAADVLLKADSRMRRVARLEQGRGAVRAVDSEIDALRLKINALQAGMGDARLDPTSARYREMA